MVPDGRQRTRRTRAGGGADDGRPRSRASTQSSDSRSELSRDTHLSSRDSVNNDDNDSASQSTNSRYGVRKLVDKTTTTPTNSSGSSRKTSQS